MYQYTVECTNVYMYIFIININDYDITMMSDVELS